MHAMASLAFTCPTAASPIGWSGQSSDFGLALPARGPSRPCGHSRNGQSQILELYAVAYNPRNFTAMQHAAQCIRTMHWRTSCRSKAPAPPVCMPYIESTACRGSWSKWARRWRPCASCARASSRACSEGAVPSLEPCPSNATSNVLARHTNAAYNSACIYTHAQINDI